MSNLLPCPFCGGSRVGMASSIDASDWGVVCSDCGSSCSTSCESDIDAVTSWNRRAALASSPAAGMREAIIEECAKISERAMENAPSRKRALDKRSRDYSKEVAREYTARGIAGNIRALASAPSGWQPMETAPRDGRAILGVWWSDISLGALPAPHIGICSWAGDWTPHDRTLTHWQPLPATPAMTLASHVPLRTSEKMLLEWLQKGDGQYGECQGETLDRLIDLGLAAVRGVESGLANGFIAKGTDIMYRAVSITDAGRVAISAPTDGANSSGEK